MLLSSGFRLEIAASFTLGQTETDPINCSLEDGLLDGLTCRSLAQIDSNSALRALQETVLNKNPLVARAAISSLERIDKEQSVVALQEALNHPDYTVRLDVVDALGEIAGPQLISRLYELLSTSADNSVLDSIAKIQDRCKFYSYELYQLAQSSA